MLLFPQQPKNLLVSAWFRPSCHCDHFRIRGPFTDPGPPTFLLLPGPRPDDPPAAEEAHDRRDTDVPCRALPAAL